MGSKDDQRLLQRAANTASFCQQIPVSEICVDNLTPPTCASTKARRGEMTTGVLLYMCYFYTCVTISTLCFSIVLFRRRSHLRQHQRHALLLLLAQRLVLGHVYALFQTCSVLCVYYVCDRVYCLWDTLLLTQRLVL